MGDYVPKKGDKYYIGSRYLYKEIFYMILDYERIVKKREILEGRHVAVQLQAINEVISELNIKYKNTYTGERFDAYKAFRDYKTFCWYRSSKKSDKAPCERTWKRYRTEFIYKVAKKLNYF